MRWFVLLLLALALVAAGCGGSDDESSAADETTIEETLDETTTDETTTDETTSDGTTTDLSDLLGEECAQLVAIGTAFSQAITGATDAEAAEQFEQLAEEVPDEIQADVKVLASWFAEYASKLEDIGIEPGQTPNAEQIAQLQTALASLDQQEVSAASERLGTWSEENCSAASG